MSTRKADLIRSILLFSVYKLWALCRDYPAAGHPVARDEAPLPLVPWLSFRLTKRCHAFIQTAMDNLCSTQNADLLEEGRSAFPEAQLTIVDQLHEVLLSEITVAGMDAPPVEVRALFESFLRQLSLPRLAHFFDLVLAQMIPRWETSAGQARSRLVCHVLRLWEDAWHRGVKQQNLCFSFRLQFVSRAGINHIAVHWQYNEILLFTDPMHVGLVDTNEFRSATALEHHRKNVQLGLRIGQAALVEFEVHGQYLKAIWILMNNKLPSHKGSSDPQARNPFWKFVVPTVSYFAWLPECLARAFCAESLATSQAGQYADPALCHADLEAYEGPIGAKFGVPAALFGLTPLGDTRNSQELSVFCQMPKERLRVSCGLVQEQEAVTHHPESRGQLVKASQLP